MGLTCLLKLVGFFIFNHLITFTVILFTVSISLFSPRGREGGSSSENFHQYENFTFMKILHEAGYLFRYQLRQ